MAIYGKRKRSSTGSSKLFGKRSKLSAGGSRYKRGLTRYASKRPARLRGSRIQYSLNRAVGRVINGLAENKLIATTRINEAPGIPIQLGAIAYYKGFIIGGLPSGWDTSLLNLAGTTITQGTSDGQRVGDQVYLRKTHLSLEIDCNAVNQQVSPKEFRVIVVKSRQSNMPSGLTKFPQNSLFIDEVGENFGYSTSGKNGSDLMLQPINKRAWSVFKDMRFTLSNPTTILNGDPTGVGNYNNWSNSKYSSSKTLTFDLPYFGKTHLNADNQPTDLDTHYLIYVFAKALGKDQPATQWECNVRGTTSYKDL